MASTVKPRFDARPYQVEILERAKQLNTIVCLGTGTGKTFISVMLIREKQAGIYGTIQDGGKRTFFLVNTVPLVYQQQKVISDHTSLNVGFYSGDMGVDFWDKARWHKEFNEKDVLVLTAQILFNMLTHAFIHLKNINLLIFDECHNASGGHPYKRILEFFENCPSVDRPHIMGLTASIINEKYKKNDDEVMIRHFLQAKMKALEGRMRSMCVTCADPEATSQYATKPIEIIKPYEARFNVNDFDYVATMIIELTDKLEKAHNKFVEEKKSKVRPISRNSQFINLMPENLLKGTFTMRSSDAYAIAADATKYCLDILTDLGPLCAYEAAKILLEQLDKHKSRRFRAEQRDVLNQCCAVLNNIVSMYVECVTASPFSSPDHVIPMEPFITRKVHVFLRDVLWQEKCFFKMQHSTDMHAIVFVQRRCTAVILSKLINFQVQADFDTFEGIWSDYVLGHGLDSNIRLADSYMKSKEQNKILEQFKKREFNVLVATSVVEEGLDVRKCNLVIRFDGINNYREYVQSKGRARAQNSKFIVLAKSEEANEMQRQLKVMQTIEKVLFEKCQNRDLPTEQEIDDAMFDEEEQLIPNYFGPGGVNAARITRNTAIPLLFRYCGKLPRDQYTNANPKFTMHQRGIVNDPEYQALCVLPLNCPLLEKKHTGEWMQTKDLAKQDVARKICMKLHQAGELDDENLLPINHLIDDSDNDDDDDDSKVKEGTRKSRSFYNRKVPDILSTSGDFQISDADLYSIAITLSDPSSKPNAIPLWPLWYAEDSRCFGIFLPRGIPKIPAFKLYTKAGTLKVEFIKLSNRNEIGVDQEVVEEFHQKIMEEASAKFTTGELSFAASNELLAKGLVVPLNSWVRSCIQKDTLSSMHGTSLNAIDTDEMQLILGNEMEIDDDAAFDTNIQNSVIRKTYIEGGQGKRPYYVIGSSDVRAKDLMEGSNKTFAQYYHEKYHRTVNPDVFLLTVVPCSVKINFAEEKNTTETKKQKTSHRELLVPELCRKASEIPADLHLQMSCLPFSLYLMEYFFSSLELKDQIAKKMNISSKENDFKFPDISYMPAQDREISMLRHLLRLDNVVETSPSAMSIFECLTTRQAKMSFDLERLEMLGDSFLKQAITVYLFFKNPQYHEGKLSLKRKNCISNKNLCRVAKRIRLYNSICNSQFGCTNTDNENQNPKTVWLPPGFTRVSSTLTSDEELMQGGSSIQYKEEQPYQEVQDKSLADSIEALIGVYFRTGGVNLALKFMQEYLQLDVLYKAISDTEKCRVKAGTSSNYADFPAASSAILRPDATKDEVDQLYRSGKFDRFENKLKYDFKDKSHLIQAMTHLSYEANDVTGCYQQYEFLGDSILDFLVTLHVYTNKPDLSPGDLTSIRSALVNNNTFALLAVQHDFYGFLLQCEPVLFSAYGEFVKLVVDNDDDEYLNSCFESPFVIVPSGSEIGYHAPKVLGDLFESVAGAIFLDSGLNLVTVWEVYYPIMQPIIDRYLNNIPLNPARELIEKFTGVNISYTETDDGGVSCQVEHNGQKECGIGKNKKIAKSTAAKRALDGWPK